MVTFAFQDQKHNHIKDFFWKVTENVDRTTFESTAIRGITSSIAYHPLYARLFRVVQWSLRHRVFCNSEKKDRKDQNSHSKRRSEDLWSKLRKGVNILHRVCFSIARLFRVVQWSLRHRAEMFMLSNQAIYRKAPDVHSKRRTDDLWSKLRKGVNILHRVCFSIARLVRVVQWSLRHRAEMLIFFFDWFDHGLIKPEDRRDGARKSMEPERRPFRRSSYFAVMSGVKFQC
jgi:hypothetical protein